MTISPLNSITPAITKSLEPASKSGNGFKDLLKEYDNVANPEQALEAYVKMTPAQRMRLAILESMGLKEGALEAMPADERKAIEDKISEAIKREMEKTAEKKGTRVDVSV